MPLVALSIGVETDDRTPASPKVLSANRELVSPAASATPSCLSAETPFPQPVMIP
jgi:hypothetical protein